jgi:hypothetical protein
MNNQQRKALASLISSTKTVFESSMEACTAEGVLEATAKVNIQAVRESVDGLRSAVEDMASEEQDKFDNMSEGLQASSRGESIQEAIDVLESATTDMESLVEKFTLSGENQISDIDWDDASSDLESVCDELEAL